MAHEIQRGYDPVKRTHYTYEKKDGKYTNNEGHGKTQKESDRDFVDTSKLRKATK